MQNLESVLDSHKLTREDYDHILKILGREPNLVEIGIFSAMWSEHCSYKSSKKYLKGFPTEAPWVIQGPGENAGVIDIGDGYAAVFKMESHNHPSFIEPYQGAATGVGGIMRDIFTMGARPIASLNSIRFAHIDGEDEVAKKHRYLMRGVVAGIGDYGNCMGVPTVGGETTFEECYAGNNLVNAFTLGIAKSDEIFYGKAEGVGNPVIYVGSKTGRDGLGGAVMSSDSFTESSKKLRPTVQVGDPFTEKLLLEACLEMFKEDVIVGIQDMGAAGLTSSSFEMAGRSGSGMIMHLDKVPMREEGMTPYELMLSESQERMLVCAKKGCEAKIIEIFEKWDLDATVIGEVTATGRMELFWHGEKCADMPVGPVSDEAPELDRPVKRPAYLDDLKPIRIETLDDIPVQEAFEKIWANPEVLDKSWIYEQYDSTVQANTMVGSGELDGSAIRVRENGRALVMSVDCNTRYTYLDPKMGAAAAVMESGRNVAVRGARPLAITDCLNYGNPMNPEVMWQFAEGCAGIKEACLALETPVVSGNVSLYNETEGVGVFPTPSIAMVGVADSMDQVVNSTFKASGNTLCLLGNIWAEFGGSLYLKALHGTVDGHMLDVDMQRELTLWRVLEEAAKQKLMQSAKDVGVGGLAVAVAKMAAHSEVGCEVNIDLGHPKNIFAESLSCAIVEVESSQLQMLQELCESQGVPCQTIGSAGGERFCCNEIVMELRQLQEIHFQTFAQIMDHI